MTAASSEGERYWISSMNNPIAVLPIGCRFGQRNQKLGQILFQIAAIALTRREVHAEFQVSVNGFHLEGPGELSQHVGGAAQVVSCGLAKIEAMQQSAQFRHQQLGQVGPFRRFDAGRAEAFLVGGGAQPVQQDGFAHAPEPQQDQALGRSSGKNPVHVNGSVRQQTVTPRQFWRLQAGAGDIGVGATIHRGNLTQINSVNRKFVNAVNFC